MAMPPPPCRPPELIDELMEEILLRLPPDKPARLAHAAVVCKRWCRVVMDPGFRRRFCQVHRTTPMLGFIVGRHSSHATKFLPCSSFRPSGADCRSWCPLDARHGRILFYCDDDLDSKTISRNKEAVLIVWTPAAGEMRTLPMPLFHSTRGVYWNATLVCVVPCCDHMECPSGGPFNVVLVSRFNLESYTHSYVYSSEIDDWSVTASIEQHGYLQRCTSNAFVRNMLYFHQYENVGIMEYDLVNKELSVIRQPPICNRSTIIVLMSVVDRGGMGFAMVDGFSLLVWLWESASITSGGSTWTIHKVVDLKSFPALYNLTPSSYIIAVADAVGVFLIWAHGARVLAVDVKNGRVWRVLTDKIVNIIPYISFCTPALRAASYNEGPSMGASNNA